MISLRPSLAFIMVLLSAAAVSAQQPFDTSNRMTRVVNVQFEVSPDVTTIGQSFDIPLLATYSVKDNVGRIEISAETHSQYIWTYNPTAERVTFSPFIFEIDLATLEMRSLPVSGGVLISGWLGMGSSFTQGYLSSEESAGFISPGNFTSSYCPDQAYVDELCSVNLNYCGQTCNVIPGMPYDPNTGKANLVGWSTSISCNRNGCGPFFIGYARRGDIRITELDTLHGLPSRPSAIIPAAAIVAFIAGLVLFRIRRDSLHKN